MGVRGFAVGLVAVGMAISAPAAGWAAPAGYTGVFAQWSLSPAAAPSTFAGTAAFAASAGMPATTVTTDSPTLRTPAGESAFLGASTGFGTYFGSSRSQPYLYLSPVSLAVPSTTTITFASVPPPGWGFAIGDIDADWMRVTGFDSTGVAVPSSALGAQDTGGTPLLNYCNNVPRPSSCVGPGPFTDHPSWLASGGVVNGTAYPPGTVLGNGTDSYGSYDWFLPDATVASITLEFHQIAGSPIYQLWLAALAPVSSISGSIVTPGTTDPVPAGTGIALQQPDGTPVLDIEEHPVVAPVDPSGAFALDTEAGDYQLSVVAPAGYTAPAPIAITAGAGAVNVGSLSMPIEPALAATGLATGPQLTLGLALVVLGLVLSAADSRARMRRGRHAQLTIPSA